MSAIESSKQSPGWYENRTFLTVTAITGLVLGMLSLGVVAAAMGTSTYTFEGRVWPLPAQSNEIAETMKYGMGVGVMAVVPCVIGFLIFALASVALYYKRGEQTSEKTEVQAPSTKGEIASVKWKNIGLVVGLALGAFAAGLVVGSSLILHNAIPHMDQLIQQGRSVQPNLKIYDCDSDHVHAHAYNFWDRLQDKWVDVTKTNMNGILTAGVFGALGGAGMCSAAILGRGIFACYSRCKKSKPVEASS